MNHLPLLEETLADIPDGFFDNTLLIGCQHLLPATSILMDCLIRKGLEKKNIFLIGKCYSTSEKTYLELKKKNIYVCPSSILYNSHQFYYSMFKKHINEFLKKIFSQFDLRKFKKIIVLDDGGELHLQMNQLMPEGLNIHGIEQTSFGFNNLKCFSLRYNIVNVARSKAKLNIESNFVAKSICKNLHGVLTKNKLKKILIFGNGFVGSAITKVLESNYDIVRYDLDFNKSDFQQNSLSEMRNSDLIIGCTGKNIFSVLLENKLLSNKTFLASGSSFDVEFNGIFFREQIPETTNCHSTFVTEHGILLNSGFPVNFAGGDADGIPLKDLQLTLALLLQGVAQSDYTIQTVSKLIELDYNVENKLISHYRRLERESNLTIA